MIHGGDFRVMFDSCHQARIGSRDSLGAELLRRACWRDSQGNRRVYKRSWAPCPSKRVVANFTNTVGTTHSGKRTFRMMLQAQAAPTSSYYRKLWIDDVMKKAAYPSA